MINKRTVDYHPSPSQLILRIHTLIFLCTPKGFIFPESFLNFFLNLYIPPWLRKSFKLIVLRLLQIGLRVKKNWICSFLLMRPSKILPQLFTNPPGRLLLPIPPKKSFLKIFVPEEKGERGLWSWKKYQNKKWYQSQVLINSTIFATFTSLVYVLLCNNLASSMLKCEGSLI